MAVVDVYCLCNKKISGDRTLVVLTDGRYTVMTPERLQDVEFGPAPPQFCRHRTNAAAISLAAKLRSRGHSAPEIAPVYGPHPDLPIAPYAEIQERFRAAIMNAEFCVAEPLDDYKPASMGFFASTDGVPIDWLSEDRRYFAVQTRGDFVLWTCQREIRPTWGRVESGLPDFPVDAIAGFLDAGQLEIWQAIEARARATKTIDAFEEAQHLVQHAKAQRRSREIEESRLRWLLQQSMS